MVDNSNNIHDLDQGVEESFEFTVKGYKYRFQQLNTEQIDQLTQIKGEAKLREFLFPFISKVDETSPDFTEIAKKMLAPNWRRFREMIIDELGV